MGRNVRTSGHVAEYQYTDQFDKVRFSPATDTTNRIVFLHGEVNEQTSAMVTSQMLHLASLGSQPIQFVISTYGGMADEMFSMYDVMKFLPCPVHTIAIGKVMSAGVLLLAAGKKGHRHIGQSTRVMMHPLSSGMYGNVFEMMNEVDDMIGRQKRLVEALASETKMTVTDIESMMKAGVDQHITAQQAIDFGIVDGFLKM